MAVHGHEEGEADEGVDEREEEVRCYSCDVAPDDKLIEVQRWVTFGREVLHVDRQEESEAEEGDDDQVDETDAHCWCGDGWTEGTEVVHCELDTWGDGLWCDVKVHVTDRDVVLKQVGDPGSTKVGDYALLEGSQARHDV